MASVTVKLDRDLEARVSKYADGCGVPLEQVLERALVFALKTRYDAVDPGFGQGKPETDPGYGRPEGGRPDQSLPGSGARPDQSLPGSGARPGQLPANSRRRCPVFDASVDNELPSGEVPPEVDNELPETAEPKE